MFRGYSYDNEIQLLNFRDFVYRNSKAETEARPSKIRPHRLRHKNERRNYKFEKRSMVVLNEKGYEPLTDAPTISIGFEK